MRISRSGEESSTFNATNMILHLRNKHLARFSKSTTSTQEKTLNQIMLTVAFNNKKTPWTVKKFLKNHAQNSWIYLSDSIFDFIDIFLLIYLRKDAHWLWIVSFCLLVCHADCGNCCVSYRPVSPSGEHAWRRFPNSPWPWGSWNRRERWAWGHWISARSVWNDSTFLRCFVVYMFAPVSQATVVLFQSRPAQSRQERTCQSTCIIVVLFYKINQQPFRGFNNSILSIKCKFDVN